MLSENKYSKYLIYAIGEIVLVVIGILIALQLNNCNKKRYNAISEQVILNDLNTEIKTNIAALENIIHEHTKSLDAAIEVKTIIKDSLKLNTMSMEDLASILTTMNFNWTYDPKLGILNSTINSGKMDLIQNKEIRYLLSSIQESIIDANESTHLIGKIRAEYYWPIIASTREVVDYEKLTVDNRTSFHDPQFIWWVKFNTAVRKEGLEEENELLKFLEKISMLIESEIKE